MVSGRKCCPRAIDASPAKLFFYIKTSCLGFIGKHFPHDAKSLLVLSPPGVFQYLVAFICHAVHELCVTVSDSFRIQVSMLSVFHKNTDKIIPRLRRLLIAYI